MFWKPIFLKIKTSAKVVGCYVYSPNNPYLLLNFKTERLYDRESNYEINMDNFFEH